MNEALKRIQWEKFKEIQARIIRVQEGKEALMKKPQSKMSLPKSSKS